MRWGKAKVAIAVCRIHSRNLGQIPSMAETKLNIKNMVCPRCIMAVQGVFDNLNIPVKSLQLGEVLTDEAVGEKEKQKLNAELKALGFELLEPGKTALMSEIKSLIIKQIHYSDEPLQVNFSTYLAENLHHDYSYLSRLFSSIESVTIEKFITRQKIEKVKELLFYDELTLSEIAHQLDYSSVAHLSSQFKKETGMTPTAFKKQNRPGHSSLDGSSAKS